MGNVAVLAAGRASAEITEPARERGRKPFSSGEFSRERNPLEGLLDEPLECFPKEDVEDREGAASVSTTSFPVVPVAGAVASGLRSLWKLFPLE